MDNGSNTLREFGNFTLDVGRKVLWWNDSPVSLPPKDVELLTVLTENPGEVMTKDELMDRLWADSFVEESNLSRHVYRLRRLFEERGEPPEIIETVPRRGYRFTGTIKARSKELVIERHSLTRTTLEEVSSESPDPRSAKLARPALKPVARWWSAAIVVSFLAAIGIYLFFNAGSLSSTKPSIRSIAVLPFRPISTAETKSHRGVAISDLLISKLSNIDRLSVRPTSSVIRYADSAIDLDTVARELSVDAVVEGSYYESNGRVLVTARLVHLADRSTVWSRDFDFPENEAVYTHREIALQIADALALDLSGREKKALSKRYSEHPDAMRLYHEARYHWSKRDNEGLAEGLKLFRRAVELDPDFALAYVGIADSTIFGPKVSEADTAIEKALTLDPELGEAYATRGFIKMIHRWDWDGAEADLKRSIDLNPGYLLARQWYATLLMIRGRSEDARMMLQRALDQDPISPNLYADLAQAEYYLGDLRNAEAHALKALEFNPDFLFAHGNLAEIYFASGRYEEGIERYFRTVAILGQQPDQPALSPISDIREPARTAFAIGGMKGYWEYTDRMLALVEDRNANLYIGRAGIKLALGDQENALNNLEIAVNERAFLAPFINADPKWAPIRNTERFTQLRSKLGLL